MSIKVDRLAYDRKVEMHSSLFEAMLSQRDLSQYLREYLLKTEKSMTEIDTQMQIMIGDDREQLEIWEHIMSEVYADVAQFKLELNGGFDKKKVAKYIAMFESTRLFAAGYIRI